MGVGADENNILGPGVENRCVEFGLIGHATNPRLAAALYSRVERDLDLELCIKQQFHIYWPKQLGTEVCSSRRASVGMLWAIQTAPEDSAGANVHRRSSKLASQ